MENVEGTVQLPLHAYEALREASNAQQINQEAKFQEISVLNEKIARLGREAEQFEMIISVWTKHCLSGGKKVPNNEYSKKLLQLVKTFNNQGLVIEITVEEVDGKYFVKPINKAETHNYED